MWPLHYQRLEVVADAVAFVEETSAMAISLTSALSAKDYHTKEAPLEQGELVGRGQTSHPSLDVNRDENLCQIKQFVKSHIKATFRRRPGRLLVRRGE
jgi:hypothetical protein